MKSREERLKKYRSTDKRAKAMGYSMAILLFVSMFLISSGYIISSFVFFGILIVLLFSYPDSKGRVLSEEVYNLLSLCKIESFESKKDGLLITANSRFGKHIRVSFGNGLVGEPFVSISDEIRIDDSMTLFLKTKNTTIEEYFLDVLEPKIIEAINEEKQRLDYLCQENIETIAKLS